VGGYDPRVRRWGVGPGGWKPGFWCWEKPLVTTVHKVSARIRHQVTHRRFWLLWWWLMCFNVTGRQSASWTRRRPIYSLVNASGVAAPAQALATRPLGVRGDHVSLCQSCLGADHLAPSSVPYSALNVTAYGLATCKGLGALLYMVRIGGVRL